MRLNFFSKTGSSDYDVLGQLNQATTDYCNTKNIGILQDIVKDIVKDIKTYNDRTGNCPVSNPKNVYTGKVYYQVVLKTNLNGCIQPGYQLNIGSTPQAMKPYMLPTDSFYQWYDVRGEYIPPRKK